MSKRNEYHLIHRSMKIDSDVEINKKTTKFNVEKQTQKCFCKKLLTKSNRKGICNQKS